MKVAVLTHYYIEENKAGGELMLHYILKEIAKNHEVRAFITTTARPNTKIDGVEVIYGANPDNVLNSYEYDIVITQFNNSEIAIADAHIKGKRVCLVVHNDMEHTQRIVCSLNKRDLIIYNTNWIKDKFTSPCKSIVVHPPICDSENITKKGDYITLVNLTPEKGVNIFNWLVRQLPHYRFLGVKGGYWKHRQIIKDKPNLKIIEQTGDMIGDVYNNSRVVLMPSVYESYGMVAAESMACGIPVICSDTKGLRENCGDAGIYVDLKDPVAWYEAVIRLMRDDRYYEEISEKCLKQSKSIDRTKELKDMIKALEGLYEK